VTALFVVFSLPRSRSYWLSRFLSHDGWHCGHDEIRHLRSLGDARAWLARPRTGTAETAAAPFWRILRRLAPDARVVVVRRDPAAVFASLLRLPVEFDAAVMVRQLRRFDAALDEITARWPGALSVSFEDLRHEATCAAVYEHCLGHAHDPAWWAALAGQNLQADVVGVLREVLANERLMARLRRGLEGCRDYSIRLEAMHGPTFGHVTVHRWSPDVARAMRRDIDAICALHDGPIYVTQTEHPHGDDHAKWRKFVTLMGFRFHTTVPEKPGHSVCVRRG
jgi:hypothetical protein